MKIEKMRFGTDLKKRFPNMQKQMAFEGGAIFTAEKDGKFYVIMDEGTLADFLAPEDEDLLDELIKIYEFDTEKERELFLQKYSHNRD